MTPLSQRRVAPRNAYTPLDENLLQHSVINRFEQVVGRFQDRLAFKTRTAALTYGELNAQANRLAHALIQVGGTQSEPVALLLAHSPLIGVGMIGTAKAGKFYVPLDPAHPPARLEAILVDSSARILVTDQQTAPLARTLASSARIEQVTLVDELDPALPDNNPAIDLAPDMPLFMNYTSGTTGRPKGMMRTHFAILGGTISDTDDFHLIPDDRWALLASYSFGATRKVFYDAWLNGSAITALDAKGEGFEDMAAWLASEQVSIFYSTTSLFRHFASTLDDALTFPALRLLIIGSEPVHAHDVKLYQRRFSDECLLVNAAGSTEVSAFAHYFMDKHTTLESAVVPIGYPVRDCEIRLLDETGLPVAEGEIGEIAVKGRFIFPGYWGSADQNDSKFKQMPDGEWMYSSGDLGRKRADGAYEHLGRRDYQIKIRGSRVEPAEVEAALLAHPAIRQAAVFAHDAPPRTPEQVTEKRLAAYVVSDRLPPLADLRRFLSSSLPDYMIPSVFVRLDALPLTVIGKVDLAALPVPDWSMTVSYVPFIAPATETEQYLAALWGELLAIGDRIGGDDNFFELGGSSINAAELVLRIRHERGVTISLPALVKQSSLKQLAALIDQQGKAQRTSSLVAIKRSGTRPPLFLVPPRRGQVMGFYILGRHAHPDLPMYAFQQPGLDGKEALLTSMGEMVSTYIADLRALQPVGPYFLAGRSFGGIIAYEMARQLQVQGQTVGGVVLFDSTFPGIKSNDAVESLDSGWEFPLRALKVFGSAPHQWIGALRQELFLLKKWVIEVVTRNPEPRVNRVNTRLYRSYKVAPYNGRVIYIQAKESNTTDHVERWRQQCTGRFDVFAVEGDHDAMFHPPVVTELAQIIDQCLREM